MTDTVAPTVLRAPQRWAVLLEYDGGPFVGWQRQSNGISVQEVLEAAIHRFSGETVITRASGRTDAGVHAIGQVVHFDLKRSVSGDEVQGALNHHMKPHPVVIRRIWPVAPDFDARMTAIQRRYCYTILNRRAPPARDRGRVWHVAKSLDVAAMQDAAQRLLGTHDFTSFRASECQAKSPVKTLDAFDVQCAEERILLRVAARSFLHHQVRNFAGTLVQIGLGKQPPEWIDAVLAAKNRAAAGQTAPPDGLLFVEARYPPFPPVKDFAGLIDTGLIDESVLLRAESLLPATVR